jgi:HK97 family phage portal protein
VNLISSLVSNIRALTMEDPAQPLQPYSVLMDMLGMTITDSGLLVNEKTALRQTTVLRCVLAISQGLSSLPLVVYQRDGKRKRPAADHRLYPLLHDEPNKQMSSIVMREGLEAQRQLWGNSYSGLQRDKAGRVVALWPLPSDRTNPERVNGELRYVTTATPNGAQRYIQPKDMLHIPGLAFDGITGISPIGLAKQTVGRALAMERFGAQFFGNGIRPSGAFVIPGSLKPEQKDNLRQTLQSATSGANAQRPLLLENGLEWKPFSINPDEAQFVDAMKFSVSEIARIFGVPLHLVQDLERATNNNIEQQALEFIMYRLRPDAVRTEQELNRKLFLGSDFFCEHSMSALLRGDFKTRMEGYATLFQTGALSPNMVCELEDWNPIPAKEGGDLRFVPMNMIPLVGVQQGLSEQVTPSGTDGGGSGTPDDPNDPDEGGDNDQGTGGNRDPNGAIRRERVFTGCRHIFRDAVQRTISRARRDKETVTKIWQPVVGVAAQMVALCLAGVAKLPQAAQQFSDGYAGHIWTRAQAWKLEKAVDITENELASAYEALCEHVLAGGNR